MLVEICVQCLEESYDCNFHLSLIERGKEIRRKITLHTHEGTQIEKRTHMITSVTYGSIPHLLSSCDSNLNTRVPFYFSTNSQTPRPNLSVLTGKYMYSWLFFQHFTDGSDLLNVFVIFVPVFIRPIDRTEMFVTGMESEWTPVFLFQRFTEHTERTDLLNVYVLLVPALQDHSTGTEAYVTGVESKPMYDISSSTLQTIRPD